MIITSFFTDNGAPKEGLTPTIDIWDVAKNNKLIDAGACEEVGGGFYKYNFETYSPLMKYNMIVDGGVNQAAGERYNILGNENADKLEELKSLSISAGRNGQYTALLQTIEMMKEGMSKDIQAINQKVNVVEVTKEVQSVAPQKDFDYDAIEKMMKSILMEGKLADKKLLAKQMLSKKKKDLAKQISGLQNR